MPAQELVDAYLPPYAPAHRLDTAKVESWGNVVTQDMFYRHRQALGEAMDEVPAAALEADREWSELTGRGYGMVERYRCEGAAHRHRGDGQHVRHRARRGRCDARRRPDGRPAEGAAVPSASRCRRCATALAGVPEVLVLDRNYSPGHGGVLHQELRAALYGMPDAPRIHGYLAGVGGVNVSPEKIAEFVADGERRAKPRPDSVWVR